jgi:hypothetical protein
MSKLVGTRTAVPLLEVADQLDQLGRDATVIANAIEHLLATTWLAGASLPSMHAARKVARSLQTHLEAASQLNATAAEVK